MKNFLEKYKNFIFYFLLAISLLPISTHAFVQADVDKVNAGVRINSGQIKGPFFYNSTNNATTISNINPIGACVSNGGSVDYFVPTRTIKEWSAFFNNFLFTKSFTASSAVYQPPQPGTYPLRLLSCVGDGFCNTYSENCSNDPGDCGPCACQYVYSDWSTCDTGTKTRSIIYGGPSGCIGHPEVTSIPCCTGCTASTPTCSAITVYNGTDCSGSVLQTSQYGSCLSGVSINSCFQAGSSVSAKYTYFSGTCYHDCNPTPQAGVGCAAGYTCRNADVYVNQPNYCSNSPTQTQTATCVAAETPNGSCQAVASNVGIIFSPGTGCTY